MKKYSLSLTLICLLFIACTSNPFDEVQGVFTASKENVEELVNSRLDGNEGGLLGALAERVIENAVFEICILNDSITGLIFLAGESTVINGNLEVENDTIYVVGQEDIKDKSVYLIPGKDNIVYRNSLTNTQITLNKSASANLSEETTTAISNVLEREREEREFRDNLGMWQEDNFVDEFGDDTEGTFLYVFLDGEKKSSRSTVTESIFVKAVISDSTLYFDIYDKDLAYKENMPDREFGQISIKKESGDILNEEVFFYNNSIVERENNDIIYQHLLSEKDRLRVLIDLSKTNEYMDEIYQFSISQSNLLEIIDQE